MTTLYGRDLLRIQDLTPDEINELLMLAANLEKESRPRLLQHMSIALLFDKPSLRTKVSFAIAIHDLGGHAIYLGQSEVGLGVREAISDIARTLSRYVDAIVARTYEQETLLELATYAEVPVINALTDSHHPCQALADLLTIREQKGNLKGIRISFIGDGNNVATSLAQVSVSTGAHFVIASPKGYEFSDNVKKSLERLEACGGSFQQVRSPEEAAMGADVIYTDVWTSMGDEKSRKRKKAFSQYRVTKKIMALAKSDALFMHDLPAHRGEEVDDNVIESEQSVVFDQAENRLHMSRAILASMLAETV